MRRFQSHFRLPGEAQKIEFILELFARRFIECNVDEENFNIPIVVNSNQSSETTHNDLVDYSINITHIITYGILMLQTDLHSPSNSRHRMKFEDFYRNLNDCIKSLKCK